MLDRQVSKRQILALVPADTRRAAAPPVPVAKDEQSRPILRPKRKAFHWRMPKVLEIDDCDDLRVRGAMGDFLAAALGEATFSQACSSCAACLSRRFCRPFRALQGLDHDPIKLKRIMV
jgi:hypothetical protein